MRSSTFSDCVGHSVSWIIQKARERIFKNGLTSDSDPDHKVRIQDPEKNVVPLNLTIQNAQGNPNSRLIAPTTPVTVKWLRS